MNNPCKAFLHNVKISIQRFSSMRALKKISRSRAGDCVVFICQLDSIWGKTRSVFKELTRAGITCKLLVVPDNNTPTNGPTLFEKEFPGYTINYQPGILDTLRPKVLFYPRPYDEYLPKDLRSASAMKNCRLAYIPYYYAIEEELDLIGVAFPRRMSFFFSDQQMTFDYIEKNCDKEIRKGLVHNLNMGYPAFQDDVEVFLAKQHPGSAFRKNKDGYKVLWTPRWLVGGKFGGSNFFNYKDWFFGKLMNDDRFSLVFRPHPLMFPFFLKNGLMSQEEKDELLRSIAQSSNTCYDDSGDYRDTIADSDLLISDNSSLQAEYALANKPMIYCTSAELDLTYSDNYKRILDANYIANNQDELSRWLDFLVAGGDAKKERRKALTDDLISVHRNAANNIASFLRDVLTR